MVTGAWPGFYKGGSHCVKVRVLTRLSCHFHNLLIKGGSQSPQDPLALPVIKPCTVIKTMNLRGVISQ